MGYRNKNRGGQFKARPRGPIKLAFGIIEQEKPEVQKARKVAPPPPAEEMVFERQDIQGTLTLKKVDLRGVAPLRKEHLDRVRQNLIQIYEAGRYTKTRSLIDHRNGELLVQFAFDQSIVDRIKGFDRNERAWDPDERLWRVFPGVFDDLFDVLGKGIQLTKEAYEALQAFVKTPYYAYMAESKLAKLIVRESWFEELDFKKDLPAIDTRYGTTSHLIQGAEPTFDDKDLAFFKGALAQFPFERSPFAHQRQGIEYLLMNPCAALLDEMGCGKSFQIASAAAILLQNKIIDRVLIVAPMSLLRTWQNELTYAGIRDFAVVRGTPQQRKKILEQQHAVFIVHYEGLRIEESGFATWLQSGDALLVFDESQRIKNLSAQTTKVAGRLRPFAARCVIATGTPISNRPLDLFSQYQVMDLGNTFGNKFAAFKNTFCEMEVQKIKVGRRTIQVEKFLGVRNGEELRDRIFKTSLRRLKTDVLDLPPILIKDYSIELRAEQKTMYQQMRDNLKIEVSSMSSDQVISEASNIIVKLLRLSQIASNPVLLDPAYSGPNAKLKELENLVDDILSDETKKIILWSHYVENVHAVAAHLGDRYTCVTHTGEQNVDARQSAITAFTEDPSCRVFVATPQSAKEGLTLLPKDGVMRADTMIYMDLSFDGGSYLQSQARFHRIGQTAERCLVIHLLAEETIDEYIRRNIVEKIETAGALLDDKEVSKRVQGASDLTKASLLKILT